MSDTYKILGQELVLGGVETPLSTTEYQDTLVYRVPENKQTSFSAITVTNTTQEDKTYSLSFVNEEDSEAVGVRTIPVYGEQEITPGFLWLGSTYDAGRYIGTTHLDGIGNSIGLLTSGHDGYGNTRYPLKFVNGIWFHFSSNYGIAYSYNGIDWTASHTDQYFNIWDIEWHIDKYVMFANSNYTGESYFISYDGVNWEYRGAPGDFSSNGWPKRAMASNGSVIVAISSGNGLDVAYSDNGKTWNNAGILEYGSNWITRVVYDNTSGYFAIWNVDYGQLFISPDGITWTIVYSPYGNNGAWEAVALNGQFVMCPTSTGDLIVSFNPITFQWSATSFQYSSGSYYNGATAYSYKTRATVYNGVMYVWYLANGNGNQLAIASTSDLINWNRHDVTYPGKIGFYDFQYLRISPGIVKTAKINLTPIYVSLEKHKAIHLKTISAGETQEIKGGVVLSEGDQVRVWSETTGLISSAFGVEIDTPNSEQSSHTGGNA